MEDDTGLWVREDAWVYIEARQSIGDMRYGSKMDAQDRRVVEVGGDMTIARVSDGGSDADVPLKQRVCQA
jgi:hypothetical protein